MFRRLVPWLGTSAVASTALLVVAGSAPAQQHDRRGGSSSGESHWSGGQPGYDNGHYSPYFGGSYGRGYYSGSYSLYYPQSYGSRYAPEAYGQDANRNSGAALSYYSDDGRMATSAPEDENAARITVRVSPGAEIWFDGEKTTQTGSLRRFVSPRIDSDREFTYEIRAHWLEGGREVNRTRNVNFRAGDQLVVSFTARQSPGAAGDGRHADVRPSSPRSEESKQPASDDQGSGLFSNTPAKDNPARSNEGDATRRGADKGAPALGALAADQSTHEGKVVRIGQDKLVMTGQNNKEHSHALTADVKMTCDGKECKPQDIKAGMKIRVTTKEGEKHTVTRIEALDRNDNFESATNGAKS
jgi:uncharacterized protein (TIGR03000 family)